MGVRGRLARWVVVPVALVTVATGCGGDGGDGDEVPSATLGTTATTLSVEDEVEAAYLRSWDVYAEAALALDPSGLEELYAKRGLEIVTEDIARLVEDNTPARFEVEHNYEIELRSDGRTVEVRDEYVNHSVLLDPDTREPIEDDPNEVLTQIYWLERIGGMWKVVAIYRA